MDLVDLVDLVDLAEPSDLRSLSAHLLAALSALRKVQRGKKMLCSFWQVHASGSEEIALEKTIPDGGRLKLWQALHRKIV